MSIKFTPGPKVYIEDFAAAYVRKHAAQSGSHAALAKVLMDQAVEFLQKDGDTLLEVAHSLAQAAVVLAPDNVEYRLTLAATLARLKRWNEAANVYSLSKKDWRLSVDDAFGLARWTPTHPLPLSPEQTKQLEDFQTFMTAIPARNLAIARLLDVHMARYKEARYFYLRSGMLGHLPGKIGLAEMLLFRQLRYREAEEAFLHVDSKVREFVDRRGFGAGFAIGWPLLGAAQAASALGATDRAVEHVRDAIDRCRQSVARAAHEMADNGNDRLAGLFRNRFEVRVAALRGAPGLRQAILSDQDQHVALAQSVAAGTGIDRATLLPVFDRTGELLSRVDWQGAVLRNAPALTCLLADLWLAEHFTAGQRRDARRTSVEQLVDASTIGNSPFQSSLPLLALVGTTNEILDARTGSTNPLHAAGSSPRDHGLVTLLVRSIAQCARIAAGTQDHEFIRLVSTIVDRLVAADDQHVVEGALERNAVYSVALTLTLCRIRQQCSLSVDRDVLALILEGLNSRWWKSLEAARAAYSSVLTAVESDMHLGWRYSADAVFRTLVEGAIALHDLRALALESDVGWHDINDTEADQLATRLLAVVDVNERRLATSQDAAIEPGPAVVDGSYAMILCGTEHIVRVAFDAGVVSACWRPSAMSSGGDPLLLERSWRMLHSRFRSESAKSPGYPRTDLVPGSGETPGNTDHRPVSLQSAVVQMRETAEALLTGLNAERSWTLTVDSVLVDLPWCSLGAMLGVPVRGMTLDPPRKPALAPPSTVLVVVSDELLDAMLGWRNAWDAGKAPPLLAQLEHSVGAERLVILRVGDPPPAEGETTNAHRVDARGRAVAHVSDALSPELVLWLTHGMPDVQAGGQMAMLGLHGGHMLRAADLLERGGRFVIPCDAPVTVTVPQGCRFVASACLAGMVDTKMPSSEAVGMVRALMASGVTEAFCPAFEVPLAETPLTRDGMRQPVLYLVEQMVAAVLAGRSMADALPGAMADVARWEKHLKNGAFARLDVDEWAWANLWVA